MLCKGYNARDRGDGVLSTSCANIAYKYRIEAIHPLPPLRTGGKQAVRSSLPGESLPLGTLYRFLEAQANPWAGRPHQVRQIQGSKG